MNSSTTKILAALAAAVVLLVIAYISIGNQIITLDEGFLTAKAQLENVYQRRADLIPNLVQTVKGYAKHEATVLEEITKARSQVGQVKIDSAQDIANFEKAQSQLSGALSRLMVVVERYPDLKADKNFLELQSQLEGTENRISVERGRFNEAARAFNTYVRRIPGSWVAGQKGVTPKPYFESQEGAKTAPKVEF